MDLQGFCAMQQQNLTLPDADKQGGRYREGGCEGILRTANDLRLHMCDRLELAEISGKMRRAWNTGINWSSHWLMRAV
jgi:hypothetical protein